MYILQKNKVYGAELKYDMIRIRIFIELKIHWQANQASVIVANQTNESGDIIQTEINKMISNVRTLCAS